MEILLKIEAMSPESPEVHYKLATTYFNLERFAEAVKYYSLCEKSLGKNFNILYMLGGSLYMNGQYNLAHMYL